MKNIKCDYTPRNFTCRKAVAIEIIGNSYTTFALRCMKDLNVQSED